MKSTSLQRK